MNTVTQSPDLEASAQITDGEAEQRLPANQLLAGVYVLFWLFFCPSRWKSYLRTIAPDLPSDVALLELNGTHWRHVKLRRLLILEFVTLPLMSIALCGLLFLIWGVPSEHIAGGIAMSIFGGMALAAIGSMVVSLASGFALVVACSIAGALSICIFDNGTVTNTLDAVNVLLAFGVACSLGSGVAASVARRNIKISRSSQILAGTVAFFVGLGFGVAAFSVVVLLFGPKFSLLGGMTIAWAPVWPITLAILIRVRRWRPAVIVFLVTGLIGAIAGAITGTLETLPAGVSSNIVYGLLVGISFGYSLSAHFSLPYVIAERISTAWVGAGVSALQVLGIAISFAAIFTDYTTIQLLPLLVLSVVGLTINIWRPVLFYPALQLYNQYLLQSMPKWFEHRQSQHVYRHAAFWDEHQRLRWTGLDLYLVEIAEHDSDEAQRAIDILSGGEQRWAVRSAQIELDARRLENCPDVRAISKVHTWLGGGQLAGPASSLLRTLGGVSKDVDAALHQEGSYNQRLTLSRVEDRLNDLQREFNRSSELYAKRFEPVLANWYAIVNNYQNSLRRETDSRQEIDSPYIIGVPLADEQALFVGRTDISARIEQLIQTRQSLSLLLYGQRRMGKTSLLNNLGHLLPSISIPLFVDLQGPVSQAADHTGLLHNMARSMIASAHKKRGIKLPDLPREALEKDPFSYFDSWLDTVEITLRKHDSRATALLALDEFEALEYALNKQRFDDQAVMGMLRNLIQHRPRTFKVLISGSHTLQELQRWSNYFVGVQVVKVGCLAEPDARKLIERPVYDFALQYDPQASQHVLDLTQGHPYLLQLLCSEIVMYKNEQPVATRRWAGVDDVEAAVPRALQSGILFFTDLKYNQIAQDSLRILKAIAKAGSGAIVDHESLARDFHSDLSDALDSPIQRELIEPVNNGYRFQIELIRRAFNSSQI